MSEQIVLSVNTVVDGRWFAAGEALPYKDAAAVPPALQPFVIISEDDDAEPPGAPTLNFQPGRVYAVNAEGAILTRAGRRQAAQLAGEAAAQAAAEEAALPEETEAALADAHARNIGVQLKRAEIAFRDHDGAPEAIMAAQEEEESAAAEQKPAPEPREFFVKRGAVFMHVGKAKLRPGESLYARQPDGWVAVGAVPPEEEK
jgi:broad specificity phosphatase PhoE